MSDVLNLDAWLMEDNFAALTAKQPLESVDGPDAVIFPPTFAAAEDSGEKGDYNIDFFNGEFSAKIRYRHPSEEDVQAEVSHSSNGNVCLVNTVGAEANRVEPLFRPDVADGNYACLVPQVLIKAGTETINLLDAGHRAGDALIRFTKFGEQVFDAFQSLLKDGNAKSLAQIAPTSIVFGVWDSRGTQAKLPRVFRSIVRAYDVKRLTRAAQYNRATKYVEHELIDEKLDTGKGDKNPLSREGFKDNPAPGAPGGVIAREIRRDMTINLAAIRRLRIKDVNDPAKVDMTETLKLRRYILGLALVAATAKNPERFDLREGCQLRVKRGETTKWHAVRYEGEDDPISNIDGGTALAYAKLAAEAFGIKTFEPFEFDRKTAEMWLALDKKTQDKLRRQQPMTKQFAVESNKAEEPAEAAPTEETKASTRKKRGN